MPKHSPWDLEGKGYPETEIITDTAEISEANQTPQFFNKIEQIITDTFEENPFAGSSI